jgi:hypothetical protein
MEVEDKQQLPTIIITVVIEEEQITIVTIIEIVILENQMF